MLHAPGHGPSPSHGPEQLQAAQPGQNPEPRPMNLIKLAATRSQSVIQVALPLEIRHADMKGKTTTCSPQSGTQRLCAIQVLSNVGTLLCLSPAAHWPAAVSRQTLKDRQSQGTLSKSKNSYSALDAGQHRQASQLKSLYLYAPFDILSTSRRHSCGYMAPPATVTCAAKARARVTAAPCCTAGNERHWP